MSKARRTVEGRSKRAESFEAKRQQEAAGAARNLPPHRPGKVKKGR